jgi:hypothetical protein
MCKNENHKDKEEEKTPPPYLATMTNIVWVPNSTMLVVVMPIVVTIVIFPSMLAYQEKEGERE